MLYLGGLIKWLLILLVPIPGLGYRSLWQTAVLSCTVAVVTAHKTKVLFTEGGAARAIDTNIQLANRANDIELLRFMVYNIGNDDTNLALTKTWNAGIEHQLIKKGSADSAHSQQNQASAVHDLPSNADIKTCTEITIINR